VILTTSHFLFSWTKCKRSKYTWCIQCFRLYSTEISFNWGEI